MGHTCVDISCSVRELKISRTAEDGTNCRKNLNDAVHEICPLQTMFTQSPDPSTSGSVAQENTVDSSPSTTSFTSTSQTKNILLKSSHASKRGLRPRTFEASTFQTYTVVPPSLASTLIHKHPATSTLRPNIPRPPHHPPKIPSGLRLSYPHPPESPSCSNKDDERLVNAPIVSSAE